MVSPKGCQSLHPRQSKVNDQANFLTRIGQMSHSVINVMGVLVRSALLMPDRWCYNLGMSGRI